mmetsp:Transcript_15567/g.42660  ORF Transcript_15567/g.42660 Transcript_15567/m.42660 type:complete len:210 (+) Transcript_15567:435-1064(+)
MECRKRSCARLGVRMRDLDQVFEGGALAPAQQVGREGTDDGGPLRRALDGLALVDGHLYGHLSGKLLVAHAPLRRLWRGLGRCRAFGLCLRRGSFRRECDALGLLHGCSTPSIRRWRRTFGLCWRRDPLHLRNCSSRLGHGRQRHNIGSGRARGLVRIFDRLLSYRLVSRLRIRLGLASWSRLWRDIHLDAHLRRHLRCPRRQLVRASP